MKTLEALYFPGTRIHSASQFPIFLLLDRLHLLQPVENGEPGHDRPDIFTSAGLCQGHTPCPLGSQRDRFLHLIRDIRERKDDYAAQLSQLAIAELSAQKRSVEDSSRTITANLLGVKESNDSPQERLQTRLWQARLTLALGEQLDREEEEIAMQMALLQDDETGLFRSLQGELDEEEETLFDELLQLRNSINRPLAGSIKARQKAWASLFAVGTFAAPTLFLTHMEEAADQLLERYQEKMHLPAETLLELDLPAKIGWNAEEVVEESGTFRAREAELLGRVMKAISREESNIAELQENWSAGLEKAHPTAETGRVRLIFYSLPGLSAARLLGRETGAGGEILGVVRWLG